jgi:hypothetical protein
MCHKLVVTAQLTLVHAALGPRGAREARVAGDWLAAAAGFVPTSPPRTRLFKLQLRFP